MPDIDLIQRYEKAYERYQNRRISWVQKFHAVVKEIPHVKYTKNIKEESIQRLEKAIWPKLSKRVKKEARKEYERRYEEGLEGIYYPKPPYIPPSEKDFLNPPVKVPVEDILPKTVPPIETNDEPDEDNYSPTVDSEAELYDWIDEVISSVVVTTSPWGTPNEIHGERERIVRLIESAFNNAKNKFGEDLKFLEYLEEKADEFHELTLKAIHGYESKGQIVYIEQGGEQALGNILTLLNFGNPISQWGEEEFTYGNYDAVFWGTGEDFYE